MNPRAQRPGRRAYLVRSQIPERGSSLKNQRETIEMAQWVKMFPTKPDDLNNKTQNHMVLGEN